PCRPRPGAGGQYAYLGAAWHPLVGFLYGWALLLLIETGAIAAVAITFAEYTLRLVDAPGVSPQPLAVAPIVVLALKVAPPGILILFAWFQAGAPEWLSASRVDETPTTALTFGAALIPI